MLYPLVFVPILKSTIWGGTKICHFKGIESPSNKVGESWEISQVKGDVSVVADGALKGKSLDELIKIHGAALVGGKVHQRFGNDFPLLIKFIDATNDLSIQVHPNDDLSMGRHGKFGKTEMWYVIGTEEGTTLYSGFNKQISPTEYVERVVAGTICDVLAKHPVKPGDTFFLPAGRVHAIGSGNFIAEIQQTSDVTYRIFDFNRKDDKGNPRELHTELAKDAIDYTLHNNYKGEYINQENHPVSLAACQYFETNLLTADKTIRREMKALDSFVIYLCIEGEAVLTDDNGSAVSLKAGTSVLVPAACADLNIEPTGMVKLLETYIP